MLISEVIQIRSKLNERIIKLDAILTKLGGKTYINELRCNLTWMFVSALLLWSIVLRVEWCLLQLE